ncbi:putative transcription factor interactor and regulator CCHC(Zn) family [Helianthus annuus]|nr:putative transcription factor interactor and regulator CCHC(Zn) family [Helianthus annuus]
MDDLDQIHPDDLEEMDITWQMAMAAFRAKNFVRRTGRNKWDGLKFTGPGKMPFELRCYNCHEPGHVARNCTKPSVNREQTPAQPAPPNPERALVTTTNISTTTSGSIQSSALVVQPSANFDWNAKIQCLNISAPENQTASENIAFMTSAFEDRNSAPDDEVPAENLAYRLHNVELIQDYKDLKNKNFTLVKNEKLYKEKIEAQKKDITKLKEELSVSNCNQLYDREIMNDLIKELEELKLKYQLNEINIKKYDTSSKLVKDICDIQLEYKEKKGCGLGYKKVPPPYNHNYTYMPYSTEELTNEDMMTYGPKTGKSSINSRSVNESGTYKMNLVSKGTVDPNSSFACADEIVDLKCEDSLGGEQAFVSDFSKTSFDKTDSGCVFGQVYLDSFHAYVSSSGPNVLGKTDNVCVEPLNNKSGDECFQLMFVIMMFLTLQLMIV